MKPRIVLWGENAQDQKVLLAFNLRAEDNRVDLTIIPAEAVTEEFEREMMKQWRNGTETAMPENIETRELKLSIADGLLPDDLRTNDTELVSRAQAEWHFNVLAAKMSAVYEGELADLKEKIDRLTDYDSATWESLKGFWDKVQMQVREKNLMRNQADRIKKGVNEAFATMKELRSKADKEFSSRSAEFRTEFLEAVDAIEAKMNDGGRLQPLFDQLKSLQKKYFNTKFTRDHRDQVWKRIDGAFKSVKEKRYGTAAAEQSPSTRTANRLQGLHGAIEKMERSVERDEKELEFQERKIARTDGQLEAQIRQAKIVMIKERVNSKRVKLEDMYKTRKSLEERLEREKKKQAEREAKEKARQERKAAEEAKKAEIAKKIAEQQQQVSKQEAEKLRQAAASISEARKKSDQQDPQNKTAAPKADYATATPVQDDDNLIMAAASVAVAIDAVNTGTPNQESDTTGGAVESEKTEVDVVPGNPSPTETEETVSTETEEAPQPEPVAAGEPEAEEDVLDNLTETVGNTLQDVIDDVRAIASVVADRAEDFIETAKEDLLGSSEQE